MRSQLRQPDRWVGHVVAGRYRILSVLGEGGVGRVYVAEQAMGNARRRLALKMLLPEHVKNREVGSRFLRECELASLVDHPNVVRIYDFGEAEGGALFIAMELVPGRSLRTILQEEGALSVDRALHVLAQVCRGVAAAHDRGIVHRDLKPDNLMVVQHPGEPDFAKVLDFGIAKALLPGANNITFMGEVLGSPPYMSPEQHMGEPIDARTDVYALGVLAYELLTGVLPFPGGDMIEWAAQHLAATPRSFDVTPAGARVPAPVRRAILRALAKERGDRPSDPRAFLAELLFTEAAIAPTAPAPERRPVVAATVQATRFEAPVAAAFAMPRVAAQPRVSTAPRWDDHEVSAPPVVRPRRSSWARRWFVRAVLAAAALTGGAVALDLVDAREVLDRVVTAASSLDVKLGNETTACSRSAFTRVDPEIEVHAKANGRAPEAGLLSLERQAAP